MAMRRFKKIYSLGKLPFHIGLFDRPSNPQGIPDTYDFEIGIDLESGLIIQMPNRNIKLFLKDIYNKGSMIGNPMSEQGLGMQYIDDFLSFIKETNRGIFKKKILEIGCGNGALLRMMRYHGAEVVGLEPSGRKVAKPSNNNKSAIIREFYPSQSLTGKFNIIMHYGVLEHVEDPDFFLESHRGNLEAGGIIFFSVPDCSYYLKNGDISIFFHEHRNYFEIESIKRLLEGVSFKVINISKGNVGDTIYVACSPYKRHFPSRKRRHRKLIYNKYGNKLKYSIKKVNVWFEKYYNDKEGVGIYCPGRFINYICKLPQYNNIRFFDDEENFYGKYYPPYNIKVENFNDLVFNPVGKMIIASKFFGKQIYKRIKAKKILKPGKIFLMEDIISR